MSDDTTPIRRARMGVVLAKGSRPRTRHINWAAHPRYGVRPICCPSGMRWRASTSKEVHDLPVCLSCIALVENAKADLDADDGIARPGSSGGSGDDHGS